MSVAVSASSTRPHVGRIFVTLLALLAVQCSGAAPRVAQPRESLLEDSAPPEPFVSPAHWRYHPKTSARLSAALDIDAQRVLFAGLGGERWLQTLGQSPTSARFQAAADLAPEELIAIARLERTWGFVGQSGTVYEATEPLGAFLRSSEPVRGLVAVAAQGNTLLAVRADGEIVRSADAGVSWTLAALGVQFVDVAFANPRFEQAGTAVALALPERLWLTRNAGVTWQPVDVPARGIWGLSADAGSALALREILGTSALDTKTLAITRLGRAPERNLPKPVATPARGPDASALEARRAVLNGAGYVEVARGDAGWRLWQGSLDSALQEQSLPFAADCGELRLAAHAERIVAACFADAAGQQARPLTFYASRDAAATWQKLPVKARALLRSFDFAVGAHGALVAAGLCQASGREPSSAREAKTSEAGLGCRALGLQYLRSKTPKPSAPAATPATPPQANAAELEFALSAIPSLAGTPLRLLFETDGRTVMVLGRSTKNQVYAVFVSRDGGKNFVARELPGVVSVEDEDGEESAAYEFATSFDVSENGSVAVVSRYGNKRSLTVLDEDGRVITAGTPPEPDAVVAAAGQRALAISVGSGLAWESLDGGVTWDGIGRAPVPLCDSEDDAGDCELTLQCRLPGCVIGDSLTRVGWQGQKVTFERSLSAPAVQDSLPPEGLREGISCSLQSEPWRELPHVSAIPAVAHAAFGQVAWTVLAEDAEHAAVSVLHGFGGARPRVESQVLLPPAADPFAVAYAALPQVEGAAALRYALPTNLGAPELTNIEVAWDNRFLGRAGRGRIAQAGAYRVGDFVKNADGTERANPALLSIAGNGVYVKVHAGSDDTQDTYYVEADRSERIKPVKWPPQLLEGSHLEYANLDKRHVPLRFLKRGQGLVRATSAARDTLFEAVTTGLVEPSRFGVAQTSDVTYHQGALALHVHTSALREVREQGRLFPVQAQGAPVAPPIAVPTQLDLAVRPALCRPNDKATTARVVVPPGFSTRHPVVVADATEPLRLFVTSEAVLYGTPAAACAAAFDTATIVSDQAGAVGTERALLILDDLENAWLFRVQPTSPRPKTRSRTAPLETTDEPSGRVEYRRMTCRFDPDLDVPPEIYATLRQHDRSQ